MKRLVSGSLSVIKYIIALFMMYAGVMTMLTPPLDKSHLGIVYETRATLVLFGIIFFLSGLTLFVGKIMKWKRWVGHGLYAIYMCFLFATFLNWYGLGFDAAVGNMVGSVIVGALYLRWKYRIYYYEPSVDKIRSRMLG